MKKIIIIDSNDNTEQEISADVLFAQREEDIERPLKIRDEFIQRNNLKIPTYSEIIEEIENIPNISKNKKKQILDKISKLLDNRLRINSFDCKLYYKAGIEDVCNILLINKNIERIENG